VDRLRARYFKYRREHQGRKPIYYDRSAWTAIPGEFLRVNPGRNLSTAS